MRRRHRRTLEAVFTRPTLSGIRWADIESLLLACGAVIEERAGSRIAVQVNGIKDHIHRPHPQREAKKALVEKVRAFLTKAGIEP